MKSSAIVLLVISLLAATQGPVSARHPADLKFTPLQFSPPRARRLVLNNGMIIYLLPDRDLPLVSILALIRTGELYVSGKKAGLASLTGHVMRTGGAGSMMPAEIDEKIEYVGASLSVDIGYDAGSARLSVLSKDLGLGLEIFSAILMRPTFAQDKIDLRKRQIEEEIRRENDTPYRILAREFRKLLYGDHPYGRRVTGTPATLPSLSRDDLVEFHARYFHPNNVILAVSGDFIEEEMLAGLNNSFGSWKKEPVNLPELPALKKRFFRSIDTVPRKLNQSTIRIGHFGITWKNPDFFPITVMNFILGGGDFTSRLMKSIRSDEGLAYYVGSAFVERREPGFFAADCQTKSESTFKAVSLMVETIEGMKKERVRAEELSTAKDAYVNAFVFRFTTSGMIVNQLAKYEYRGLPPDFLETYVENIVAVTPGDVLRVAREYLHPEKAIILVVGDESAFGEALATMGPVNVIELGE